MTETKIISVDRRKKNQGIRKLFNKNYQVHVTERKM